MLCQSPLRVVYFSKDMKILVGDIFQSKAQTLINTVNCVGVMGKGIALEFKERFPEMFEDYIQRCERKEMRLGEPYIFRSLFGPQVINFPTKDHWKSLSKISDIEKGLEYLLAHYKEWDVTSLALPPLGCGNGQLEWRQVGPMIYKYAKQMNIPVEMYAPYGVNPKELTVEFLEQGMKMASRQVSTASSAINPAWLVLVEIIDRIERAPYHWPIGRTIFQKIAYVATAEGLPTGLSYQRGSFGPFSYELKGVEAKLINSNFLQEQRSGRMFMAKVGPNFVRIRKSLDPHVEKWSAIIDKTVDLFTRVNTDQAEIIATVLFATRELKASTGIPSESDVLEAVMEWKRNRRPAPLKEEDVLSTIRHLAVLNWIEVKPDPAMAPLEEDFVLA